MVSFSSTLCTKPKKPIFLLWIFPEMFWIIIPKCRIIFLNMDFHWLKRSAEQIFDQIFLNRNFKNMCLLDCVNLLEVISAFTTFIPLFSFPFQTHFLFSVLTAETVLETMKEVKMRLHFPCPVYQPFHLELGKLPWRLDYRGV